MPRKRAAPWLLPLAALGLGAALVRYGREPLSRAMESMHQSSMPSARLYDLVATPALERFYRRVAREAVSLSSTGAALDVGCGPGGLAIRLAEEAPGLQVTGMDVSPEMVELAGRRVAAAGLAGRVDFRVGAAEAMPFPDGRFDLVVSTLSLHHWPDAEAGLAEVHRVLKLGGQACIYDVPRWLSHLEMRKPGLAGLADGSTLETVWRIGPIPVLIKVCVRK